MSWQHISTLCPKGYPNQHGHAVSLRVTAPRQQHDKASSRALLADVGRERLVCSRAERGPLAWNQCQCTIFFSRQKLLVCLNFCLSGAHGARNRGLLCDRFFLVPKYNQLTNSCISFWILIEHHNWCRLY